MRQHTVNTQTWEPAITNINRMERAVVNLMTKLPDVTPADVVDWVVPAEELRLLRAASPHTDLNSSSFSSDQMRSFTFPFGKITMYLDFVHMGCIPPKKSLIAIQSDTPKAGVLRAAMETVVSTVTQHSKLRTILAKFKHFNVTPGAARHYFPTLQSLLPTDHAFFKVSGERFKDVYLDHDTVELLREAPEIIARGLLCNPNVNGKDKPGRSLFRVQVSSEQQVFTLLAKETA